MSFRSSLSLLAKVQKICRPLRLLGLAGLLLPATLPLPDYERWDATEVALRIRGGDVKPSEVLEAAIARAEAYAAINAITVPHFDMARAAARTLDGAGQAGVDADDCAHVRTGFLNRSRRVAHCLRC